MIHTIKHQYDKLKNERDAALAHADLLAFELTKILESNEAVSDREKKKLLKLLRRRPVALNILYVRLLSSLEQHLRESTINDIKGFRTNLSSRIEERNHPLLRLRRERITSRFCS